MKVYGDVESESTSGNGAGIGEITEQAGQHSKEERNGGLCRKYHTHARGDDEMRWRKKKRVRRAICSNKCPIPRDGNFQLFWGTLMLFAVKIILIACLPNE